MAYKKKKNDVFANMQKTASGIAGLGITTAVGATITGKTFPQLSPSLNVISSFAPIAVTASMGKIALDAVKKKKVKTNVR